MIFGYCNVNSQLFLVADLRRHSTRNIQWWSTIVDARAVKVILPFVTFKRIVSLGIGGYFCVIFTAVGARKLCRIVLDVNGSISYYFLVMFHNATNDAGS